MKLFTVETTVPRWRGFKDVEFSWLQVGTRTPGRPYEMLIEDYDPSDPSGTNASPENRIDELFTEFEAAMLKRYLDQEHPDVITEIKGVKLPILNNSMGWLLWPLGVGMGFYRLSQDQGYHLPFKVWGHFNLRICDPIYGSNDFSHRRLLLLFPESHARMKANAEAVGMLDDDGCPS